MEEENKAFFTEAGAWPDDLPAVAQRALIKVRPQADPAISQIYDEAQILLRFAEARVITTEGDLTPCTDDLAVIAGVKKRLEEKRREYIEPIESHLKTFRETFSRFIFPLTEADRINREKWKAFKAEIDRRRQEAAAIDAEKQALARREAELKGGEITVDLTPVDRPAAAPNKVRTDMGSAGTFKVWRFEVENFNVLSDEYKLPDMVKIRKVISAGVKIAGIKAWQEESIRITPK